MRMFLVVVFMLRMLILSLYLPVFFHGVFYPFIAFLDVSLFAFCVFLAINNAGKHRRDSVVDSIIAGLYLMLGFWMSNLWGPYPFI